MLEKALWVRRTRIGRFDLQIGPRLLAFTSETFILSFSLPNFHFHAVTAYDILRTRGVPLGKRDFEGQLRTRPARSPPYEAHQMRAQTSLTAAR